MKGNTLLVVKVVCTTVKLKQCITNKEILSAKNWLLDPINDILMEIWHFEGLNVLETWNLEIVILILLRITFLK